MDHSELVGLSLGKGVDHNRLEPDPRMCLEFLNASGAAVGVSEHETDE
jgi:hypothetical protein